MPDQPNQSGKSESIPNLSGAAPLGTKALVKKAEGTVAPGTGDTSIAPGGPLDGGENPPRPMSISVEFGRYRILRPLGEGAMGAVYLAEDSQLQRQVALKIPQLDASRSGSRLERFYREARLAATLNHPNICPIFDVGEFQGTHFISMAYVQGKSLETLLKSGKPQSERTAASLVRKVALALQEAHAHNVIHRDLKPANIMIDQRGEPIVMDFGLARQVNSTDQAQITHNGAILGTPSYMSPEQVQGKTDEVGAASDIYGLGVILYQLLAGRLPFQGSVVSVLAQIATQTPTAPSSHRPGLNVELESICLKAMSREAKGRYDSMAEFAAALADWIRANPRESKSNSVDARESRSGRERTAAGDSLSGILVDVSQVAAQGRAARQTQAQTPWGAWSNLTGRGRIMAVVCSAIGVVLVGCVLVWIVESRDKPPLVIADARTEKNVSRDDPADKGRISEREPAASEVDQPGEIDSSEPDVADSDNAPNDTSAFDQPPPADGEDGAPPDAEPKTSDEHEQTEPSATDPAGDLPSGKASRKAVKKAPRPARPAIADVFAVNSTWNGRFRSWFAGEKTPHDGDLSLTVTDRNKDTFKAIVHVGKGNIVYEVPGRITKRGTVIWSTADANVKIGAVGLQSWSGPIVNGNRLELQHSGKTTDKREMSGVATVHLQQP